MVNLLETFQVASDGTPKHRLPSYGVHSCKLSEISHHFINRLVFQIQMRQPLQIMIHLLIFLFLCITRCTSGYQVYTQSHHTVLSHCLSKLSTTISLEIAGLYDSRQQHKLQGNYIHMKPGQAKCKQLQPGH